MNLKWRIEERHSVIDPILLLELYSPLAKQLVYWCSLYWYSIVNYFHLKIKVIKDHNVMQAWVFTTLRCLLLTIHSVYASVLHYNYNSNTLPVVLVSKEIIFSQAWDNGAQSSIENQHWMHGKHLKTQDGFLFILNATIS